MCNLFLHLAYEWFILKVVKKDLRDNGGSKGMLFPPLSLKALFGEGEKKKGSIETPAELENTAVQKNEWAEGRE